MQILDILRSAQAARIDGCNNILSLVPGNKVNGLFSLLVERPGAFYENPDKELLESVTEIVKKHAYESQITDWPFENFWDNPKEPRHSKLIAYFVDRKMHANADYMLKKLFKIFNQNFNFPADEIESYEVIPETRVGDSYGQIDILINCKTINGREFVVIIENKVNHAPDQPNQLERYVRKMVSLKYKPEDIYVFYLPLTATKNPQENDRIAVLDIGAIYHKITFKEHILDWLESIVNDPYSSLHKGMLENIGHYKNLIQFLIKKNNMTEINNQILENLIAHEKVNQKIPSLNQVAELRKSLDSLDACLRKVFHGRLLLEISAILKSKGIDVVFRSEENNGVDINVDLPYYLPENVNLCVSVKETLGAFVCYGINYSDKDNVGQSWIGYLRTFNNPESRDVEKIISNEALVKFGKDNIDPKSDQYYGYKNDIIDYSQGGSFVADCIMKLKHDLEDKLTLM